MSELLTRTLTSSMNDPELFNFIELLIIELDTTQESVAGFPLSFSVRLCQHLGLAPYNNYSNENPYFDLMEGKFVSQIPQHNYFLETTLSCSFSEVLSTIDAGIFAIEMPYKIRVDLLSKLHEYYRLHIPTFGEMKSVQVLSDVFRD
jgi:DNA repair protein RecO (recombination protein O)